MLVAHIVPLHHSQDDVLVGAAAVAWQPEPGLEALHGDGALLPAASEEDPGLLKGVSFGACQLAGGGCALVGWVRPHAAACAQPSFQLPCHTSPCCCSQCHGFMKHLCPCNRPATRAAVSCRL